MKAKNIIFFALILVWIFSVTGCSNKDNPAGNTEFETSPEITNIIADKTEILFGGNDIAILTCNATGGNLKYEWQVDLGDLIPLNSERSKVSFTGAECYVGEKIITCKVSNSKGSVSKSIILTILEVITQPEIITIESDKSELKSSTEESANIVCYAIGGNLKYDWKSDCGNILLNKDDNSKITYMPLVNDCIGVRTITCIVSNEKGTFTQTFQITVK